METKQQLADVVVGARGWLHEGWMDGFYPEDIPADWLFGFYANEFNTLLVPWSLWSESIDALEEGLEDADDDFHLYLELPEQHQLLPAHLHQITNSVTGLVNCFGEASAWQEQVDALGKPLLARLPRDDMAFQCFSEFQSEKEIELVLIDSASGIDDLMVMREQLELALQLAGSRLDVIFTDAEPELEAMRNTRMIAELLGA